MLQSREASEKEIAKTGLIHRVYHPDGDQPAGYGSGTRPMVFMVHGRAGNASVMWFFSKVFAGKSPIIVSPQAPEPDSDGGFSWWSNASAPRADDTRTLEEKFLDATQVALRFSRFVEAAIDVYRGDEDNLVAAGFSQGSGVASTLSLLEPKLFRGVAILSGFIPKAVMDSIAKLPVTEGQKPRYFVAHGTKDDIIPIRRANETVEWLRSRNLDTEFHQEDVTHKVGTRGVAALTSWYRQVSS